MKITIVQLLRRYRLPVTLALPAGLAVGVLIGLGLFAVSDEGTRTLGWLGYTVMLGAGVGVVSATIACLGAACAVALDARRRPLAQPRPELGLIALGAGAGLALVVAVVGLTFTVVQDSWSQMEFWLIASFVLGATAAIAAVAVTAPTIRYRGTRA